MRPRGSIGGNGGESIGTGGLRVFVACVVCQTVNGTGLVKIRDVARLAGVEVFCAFKHMKSLREIGLLERVDPADGGRAVWRVTPGLEWVPAAEVGK